MKTKLMAMAFAAALATSAVGLAAAAPGATPNGLVGACNMMRAGEGMANAMAHNAPQGHDGMHRAMLVSGCTHHTD